MKYNDTNINLSTQIENLPTWVILNFFSKEYSSQLQHSTNDQSAVSGNIKFSFNNKQLNPNLGVELYNTKFLPDNIFSEFKIKADNDNDKNKIKVKTD